MFSFSFLFLGMLVIQCNTECVQNLTPGQVVSETVVKTTKYHSSLMTYVTSVSVFFSKRQRTSIRLKR